MIQQPDSIKHQQAIPDVHPQAADVQETHVAEQAPAEQIAAENGALQLLHAQEDSTARSIYTARINHWPVKIDSLLMPKEDEPIPVTVNKMPEYYKQSFFAPI